MATQPDMAVMGTRQATVTGTVKPLGYIQQSVTTVAALTFPTNVTKPVLALIQCQDNNVRWIDDGATTATTSVGMLLYVGDTLRYNGDLSAFRVVSTSGTAKLNISFYGY